MSIYFQDHITFSEQFKAVLALRYDREKQKSIELRLAPADKLSTVDAVVPMAGILFQPTKAISFYASTSKSFNPPSPNDVDANGIPLTTPENGTQYEAGAKYTALNNRLKATLAFYHIDLSNSIVNLGGGVFGQIGGLRSKGMEIEVNAAPIDGWELQAGYSYNDSGVRSDLNPYTVGQRLFNSPEHSVAMFTRYRIQNGPLAGLGASLGATYVGQRFATFAANAADRRVTLPSYTRFDLGLYYDAKDFELALRFRNILDEKYIEGSTGSNRIVPGDPASISFMIQKKF